MRAIVWIALCVAACSGNAAESEPQQVCTLIGCNDGLSVVVASALAQDYSVTVKSGGATLHTFTCRAGSECRAFLENQTPAQVTIEIATSAGTVTRSYTPEYKVSQPNGPDCPPECRQATVTVNVS